MGRGRRLSGAATALAFVVGVAASVAHATTMRRASVEELAHESAAVVLGRVVSTEARLETLGGRRGIYTHVALRVDEWLRGRGDSTVELVVHGGRVGDDVERVHGQARFDRRGEEVVVFLLEGGGVLWPTGMSQGKWLVHHTAADTRVTSTADPSALAVPPGQDPASLSNEMSLDELRRRVGAR